MADSVNAGEFVTSENRRSERWSRKSPFPHMSPYDTAVWTAFLAVRLVKFDWVRYDVGLGGSLARRVRADDDLKEMWETLLRKRVDVVAGVGGEAWCIEVKPTATMSALGQALAYADLWDREKLREEKARAVVVCARVDEDLEPTFVRYGVTVIVVSGDGASEPYQVEKVFLPAGLDLPR